MSVNKSRICCKKFRSQGITLVLSHPEDHVRAELACDRFVELVKKITYFTKNEIMTAFDNLKPELGCCSPLEDQIRGTRL